MDENHESLLALAQYSTWGLCGTWEPVGIATGSFIWE